MMGHSAAVLCALATMAAAGDREVASICHNHLNSGQKFEIHTADHVYRGELVDRWTGKCEVASSADGTRFSAPRTMYLLGATPGPETSQMLVVMREIRVGLKMELGLGDLEPRNRIISGEVRTIRLVN